jgi:hypothetical protein
MSVLQKLTEGIVNRDLKKEGDALLSKWEKTGLLEGLEGESSRNGMARLLENQAKQLLKEASSMAAGDVEGFASVAFPLVRRVFGGLLANDLVSVQPMSLPSGLIFFLDFTYESGILGTDSGDSIYGGGKVASQITGGVSDITEEGGGLYNLVNVFASPTGSLSALTEVADADPDTSVAGEINIATAVTSTTFLNTGTTIATLTAAQKKSIRFDPDILSDADTSKVVYAAQVHLSAADVAKINYDMLQACVIHTGVVTGAEAEFGLTGGTLIRRLTERGYRDENGTLRTVGNTTDALAGNYITFYWVATSGTLAAEGSNVVCVVAPLRDVFSAGGAVGSVIGGDNWGLEEPMGGTGNAGSTTGKNEIPEIDIKVDSVAVTAITKKLKAKWSPELGQDLNAYHNLDAEVELTSILSEQIALEIDREILNDLLRGATAGTQYWSRSPGLFVNRVTGAEIGATSAAPDFTGTVSEWYETLIETINDVSAQIHRKTLRGGANFVVCSPEVANILEFTAGFRASVTADADRGTIGAVKVGSVSKKWDVYVDPYFPRNLVLVGRKGGSFLESGYVYAPYVPLQVTPTIFGTEDFIPRKGVMTRYAKKMVRPDMYGVVVVRGLLGESGAS